MTRHHLRHLQAEHAFDPFLVRQDLGTYHVPFNQLVGGGRLEAALLDACQRPERVAVIGESGSGKSSLTATMIGPLAEGVAPIMVPVAVEPTSSSTREPCLPTSSRSSPGVQWSRPGSPTETVNKP